MSGLVRFSRCALRTLQPKIFSLTSQKRFKPVCGRFFPEHADEFKQRHLGALQVRFEPADKYEVIPDVKVTVPEKYLLPKVNHNTLISNVENLELEDDHVKTFVDKLHDVVNNCGLDAGTSESMTNNLVNNLLLNVVNFNTWPFKDRIKPPLNLITPNGFVLAKPEFVIINKKKIVLIGVEDKYLTSGSINSIAGFGEWQIAAEILACGYENILEEVDYQEIFAFRVISTYVTFYRAEIPALYWEELTSLKLPIDQSIVIKRWPKENGKETGLNLAKPEGRRAVITNLIKIRQYKL